MGTDQLVLQFACIRPTRTYNLILSHSLSEWLDQLSTLIGGRLFELFWQTHSHDAHQHLSNGDWLLPSSTRRAGDERAPGPSLLTSRISTAKKCVYVCMCVSVRVAKLDHPFSSQLPFIHSTARLTTSSLFPSLPIPAALRDQPAGVHGPFPSRHLLHATKTGANRQSDRFGTVGPALAGEQDAVRS